MIKKKVAPLVKLHGEQQNRGLSHTAWLFVCKWTLSDRQHETWGNHTHQWAGCTPAQVFPPNLAAQTVGYVIQLQLCLLPYQHLKRRVLLRSQQMVPWKWNLIRSHYQISGSDCAQNTKCAVKTLMTFATTFLCESVLSALKSMKTKYRARFCVENDLRLRLSQNQPNIAAMCASSNALICDVYMLRVWW